MKKLGLCVLTICSVCLPAVRNLQTVHRDILYRSGQPDRAGYSQLSEMGIRTVVNLEDNHPQEKGWANQIGIDYYNVPIGSMSCPTMSDINEALRIIASERRQPVLVHCHRGMDRTGIIIAAYRIRYDGWSVARAKQEMRSLGHMKALYKCDSILDEVK